MPKRDDVIAEFQRQVEDLVPQNTELTDEQMAGIGNIDLDDLQQSLIEDDEEADLEQVQVQQQQESADPPKKTELRTETKQTPEQHQAHLAKIREETIQKQRDALKRTPQQDLEDLHKNDALLGDMTDEERAAFTEQTLREGDAQVVEELQSKPEYQHKAPQVTAAGVANPDAGKPEGRPVGGQIDQSTKLSDRKL